MVGGGWVTPDETKTRLSNIKSGRTETRLDCKTRLESKVFSLDRLCPSPKSIVFYFSIPLFPRDGVKWCG